MYSSEYEEEQMNNNQNNNFYQNNKILIWIFIAIILIVIGIVIFSKKGNGGSDNSSSNYSISIYPKEDIYVSLGSSYKLAAIVDNNPDATITWTSSDETIAKVDNGSVTGINYGTVVITATYIHNNNEKYEAIKDVTVAEGNKNIPVTDISIKNGDLILPLNGKYNINMEVTPPNGFISSIVYTSSNTSVATVNSSGFVEAHDEGEATITLNVNNGAFVRNLKVFVNKDYTSSEIVVNPDKIELSKEINKIKVGGSAKISYTVTPIEASEAVITWTSSDEGVLTVDRNGIISALKEGKATIKATASNGINDVIEIEVEPKSVLVTDIELSTTELYLEVGQSQVITPIIRPDDATDKTFTCTSSDSALINTTISDDGTYCTISAQSSGMGTITIKANNSEISKTINVTITNATPIDSGSSGSSSGGSSCKKTCPDGKYVSNCKCVTCEAGYYCKGGKKSKCSSGYTSKAGASSCTRSSCSAGTYLDSSYSTGCRPCPSGKYCPGGTSMPKTCQAGYVPNASQTGCKKSCASMGTSTTCIQNGCKWDYTYGCH